MSKTDTNHEETPESRAVIRRLQGMPSDREFAKHILENGDGFENDWLSCPKCCAEYIKTGAEGYDEERDMYPVWRTKSPSGGPYSIYPSPVIDSTEIYDFECTQCHYKFHVTRSIKYDDGHVYTPEPKPKKPRKQRSDKGIKRGPQPKATKRRKTR